jgi:hypothetical protein
MRFSTIHSSLALVLVSPPTSPYHINQGPTQTLLFCTFTADANLLHVMVAKMYPHAHWAHCNEHSDFPDGSPNQDTPSLQECAEGRAGYRLAPSCVHQTQGPTATNMASASDFPDGSPKPKIHHLCKNVQKAVQGTASCRLAFIGLRAMLQQTWPAPAISPMVARSPRYAISARTCRRPCRVLPHAFLRSSDSGATLQRT